MLLAQFSETDCRKAFVLVTDQIQTAPGWLAAGALQSCVGLTLDSCKYCRRSAGQTLEFANLTTT